jgi:extradiol dioxygenase family protein
MQKISPFHLAIPVHDLSIARDFYENKLGLVTGRTSDQWADYNFFGHQLVVHEVTAFKGHKHFNEVDGKSVPIPHFGIVLPWDDFQNFSKHLISKNVPFEIAPYLRFEGKAGEQMTLFFYDPSGNALEFKCFRNMDQLFAT